MDKRFIEESFPVKEVSIESANEKTIRHGHISTLHIWWARKPLASSRATNYAALIPAAKNKEDYEKKRKFIIELCKWENSLNKGLIDKARKEILEANGGKPPKVLDPFSGGGAIPLEALKLGCETYANDYNPVAVLIEKCTLEYPQKYGKKVVDDVKKWGDWILKECKQDISDFYPSEEKVSKNIFGGELQQEIPIGYYWLRTVCCQNPSCEAKIPLAPVWWLCDKSSHKVLLYPYVEGKKINFKIVGDGYDDIPKDFDPNKGSIARAIVECPVCGSITPANDVRKQFIQKKANQRMIAVIFQKKGERGKNYRIATDVDEKIYQSANKYLESYSEKLRKIWGSEPIPDEELPLMSGTFNVPLYGFTSWGDLFNFRQKLALVCIADKIRKSYKEILHHTQDEEYSKCIVTYLALALNRLASFSTQFCRWKSGTEQNIPLFSGRSALPMVFNYFEVNILGEVSNSWSNTVNTVLEFFGSTMNTKEPATVIQASAMNMPYQENYFDAVLTDPPYYNSVPYADLSDFFYIWLKRSIGDLFPEFFSTPLTPKTDELIEMASWDKKRYAHKTNEFFEKNMKKAFQEIYRMLKPGGISIIVYAHKTTAGWETVINALLDSGLTVTASWPINTEMQSRLRAKEAAALASSIYIVARKIKKKELGLYPKVKKELHNYLNDKLERLWDEGISGADFFIAAIGAGIEIFGKYEKIIDDEGKIIRADKMLEEIRSISTNFAVKRILHDGFTGEISPLSRFYVLWRWNWQEAKVPYDDARKLAQSTGINLEKEWNKSFIKKEKEFIRVVGPKERNIKDLEKSEELIDVLHYVLLLWEKGDKKQLLNKLSNTFGSNEAFYRVAQAVSQTLPMESKERKLLDGFLSGREKIKEQIKDSKLGRWVK